jgi:pimeloyl-ACP methyl ester carboxylesterase
MKKIIVVIWFILFVCITGYATHPGLFSYRNFSGLKRSVDTITKKWDEKKRQQIIKNMERAMGKLPRRSNLPALDIRVTDSLKEDTYTRYTITFTVAQNERVPAYLYIPFQKGTPKKLPSMLVLHETDPLGKGVVDGQGATPNRAHAKELAQRGYVVIAPDYPGFGDSKDYDFDNDRYKSGTMKGIFNHMRCVDLLQAREDVDPIRIGVIGHSLGGHNAMFVGAFDTRLKVIVSSSGWTQMDYYNVGEETAKKYGGRLAPWAQKLYMPLLRDKYKLDGKKIPFDFDEVISALAPRAFFSSSPLKDSNFHVKGVREGIAEGAKVYRALGAENKFQVRYPDAGHDFPVESRIEAYRFIDKILEHTPRQSEIK